MATGVRVLAALAGVLAASMASAAVIYDSKGFENPPFNAGDLKGQQGWTVSVAQPGDAVIQNTTVHQGTQALQVKPIGSRVVARLSNKVVKASAYVDLWLKPPANPEDYAKSNVTINLRGRDASNKGNIIFATVGLTHKGAISGTDAKYTLGEWNRFTIHVDVATDTWSLYINDQLAASDQPFAKDADAAQIDTYDIDWTSQPGTTADGVFVDDFQISDTNPIAEAAGKPAE